MRWNTIVSGDSEFPDLLAHGVALVSPRGLSYDGVRCDKTAQTSAATDDCPPISEILVMATEDSTSPS